MKKIEKIEESKYTSDNIYRTMSKVNEIIDRLNQEVSQPEEKKDDNNWYCECGEPANSGKHICKHKEVENNTEECKHKYILESHCMGLLRVRCPLCGDTRDIADSTPIQELLSERSFSREELGYIRDNIVPAQGGEGMCQSVLERVDRLLSLETK